MARSKGCYKLYYKTFSSKFIESWQFFVPQKLWRLYVVGGLWLKSSNYHVWAFDINIKINQDWDSTLRWDHTLAKVTELKLAGDGRNSSSVSGCKLPKLNPWGEEILKFVDHMWVVGVTLSHYHTIIMSHCHTNTLSHCHTIKIIVLTLNSRLGVTPPRRRCWG